MLFRLAHRVRRIRWVGLVGRSAVPVRVYTRRTKQSGDRWRYLGLGARIDCELRAKSTPPFTSIARDHHVPRRWRQSIPGICLTSDIDTLLNHMNNARYIRELDFAKLEFYERTGLYQHVRSIGGSMAMGATTIRYRRYIKVFSRYYITTKVIYWDDKGIYIEHRFVSPKDNFINAVVMCKLRLMNCSVEDVMSDLMANVAAGDEPKRQKPEISPELEKWIECNEISSANLRSELKV